MSTLPLHINYYISGHGFGHATRSAKIIEALLQSDPRTHITVISTAPEHLFPASERLTVVSQQVDSAVIQPQPYSIDAIATFAKLRGFLQQAQHPEWQARAAALIKDTGCNLIIADAPSPVAWLGHNEGIPSILISNFGFDGIFTELLKYLPAEVIEENTKIVSEVVKTYATYDYLVRLPGCIDFPFVQHHWTEQDRLERIIDAPLVFRQPRATREETLEKLYIPKHLHGSKILLVQFGGQLLSSSDSSTVPKLPDGWICLLNSPFDNDPRFFRYPPDIYLPDVVSAADAILGKFGYGTVSECVGMQRPLIYVRRPMFAEEPGLIKYMQNYGVCTEISVEDYETGNWTTAINNADYANAKERYEDTAEGSSRVADIVRGLRTVDRA